MCIIDVPNGYNGSGGHIESYRRFRSYDVETGSTPVTKRKRAKRDCKKHECDWAR